MAETVTIDGRGVTIQEAIQEMWVRVRPLEQRGFHPISEVEVVETAKREIIQTFQLTDPEFIAHLGSDQQQLERSATAMKQEGRLKQHPHAPERKEHYAYIARIRLEA